MAKYKSRFAKLSFYCCGERKQFNGGVYETTEKCEIELLDKLTDAVRVESTKPAAVEPKEEVKEPPKAEEKPKGKITSRKSTPRKSSAK